MQFSKFFGVAALVVDLGKPSGGVDAVLKMGEAGRGDSGG
jgi:hypothetical protein